MTDFILPVYSKGYASYSFEISLYISLYNINDNIKIEKLLLEKERFWIGTICELHKGYMFFALRRFG